MGDYIKREDAIRKIVNKAVTEQLDSEAIGKVVRILTDIDKTDVRENVRGEWIFPYGDKKYKRCSVCGSVFYSIPYNTNFCPSCGADMRGKE